MFRYVLLSIKWLGGDAYFKIVNKCDHFQCLRKLEQPTVVVMHHLYRWCDILQQGLSVFCLQTVIMFLSLYTPAWNTKLKEWLYTYFEKAKKMSHTWHVRTSNNNAFFYFIHVKIKDWKWRWIISQLSSSDCTHFLANNWSLRQCPLVCQCHRLYIRCLLDGGDLVCLVSSARCVPICL